MYVDAADTNPKRQPRQHPSSLYSKEYWGNKPGKATCRSTSHVFRTTTSVDFVLDAEAKHDVDNHIILCDATC